MTQIQAYEPKGTSPTVGEEFIIWAEQYWKFEEKMSAPLSPNDEKDDYEFTREIFMKKIDDIIRERLHLLH